MRPIESHQFLKVLESPIPDNFQQGFPLFTLTQVQKAEVKKSPSVVP